jgi:putative membrane protein
MLGFIALGVVSMNGFIPGSRGTFMLDVVALAMILMIPVMGVGIQFAKKRKYEVHKRMMMALSGVLGVAVVMFELEMRLGDGWMMHAEVSPFFGVTLYAVLAVHLAIAVSTCVCLAVTIVNAMKKFDAMQLRPGAHSVFHRRWGQWSAVGLTLTSLTGWVFYWMAFIASV